MLALQRPWETAQDNSDWKHLWICSRADYDESRYWPSAEGKRKDDSDGVGGRLYWLKKDSADWHAKISNDIDNLNKDVATRTDSLLSSVRELRGIVNGVKDQFIETGEIIKGELEHARLQREECAVSETTQFPLALQGGAPALQVFQVPARPGTGRDRPRPPAVGTHAGKLTSSLKEENVDRFELDMLHAAVNSGPPGEVNRGCKLAQRDCLLAPSPQQDARITSAPGSGNALQHGRSDEPQSVTVCAPESGNKGDAANEVDPALGKVAEQGVEKPALQRATSEATSEETLFPLAAETPSAMPHPPLQPIGPPTVVNLVDDGDIQSERMRFPLLD